MDENYPGLTTTGLLVRTGILSLNIVCYLQTQGDDSFCGMLFYLQYLSFVTGEVMNFL